MEKLKMHSVNKVDENVKKIGELFPNCVTERMGKNGEPEYAVDFDMLRQELSSVVVEGNEERYQFTWPDKKKAILLANAPISATLRPCREESVDFDNTKNLYIEGDNLDVLKLLQETYLGQIKMIYIDPPYNTGNDFVYEDDFAEDADEYLANSGQYDKQGNRLVQNLESNGRFHTDWLNMIYPRLKLAKDLMSDDGVIFISLDDSEIYNAKKVCDEVFGRNNFICNFVRKNKAGSGHDSEKIAIEYDYILCYAKSYVEKNVNQEPVDIDNDPKYKLEDEYLKERGRFYLRDLDYKGSYSVALDYPITAPDGTIIYSGDIFGKPNTWRWSKEKFEWGKKNGYIVFKKKDKWKVYIKQYQYVDNTGSEYIRTLPYRALVEFMNGQGTADFDSIMETNSFSYPKSVDMLKHLLKIASNKDSIILDFFSGSATTAHAIIKYNSEDGGKRRFVLVQLPELTNEESEAYKAGYKNICEIGKERIRRAGKKIKEDSPMTAQDLDIGFRVLKLDTSNIKDVSVMPGDADFDFTKLADNIKEDRTPEDLLFQVMLDLGVELSASIREETICGKKVFYVAEELDNFLIACFDKDVTDDVITEIAKKKPYYFVTRDASMATDSVATNFDQIFETYSPTTVRKVL